MSKTPQAVTQPPGFVDLPPEMQALVYKVAPRARGKVWDDPDVFVFLVKSHRRIRLSDALKQIETIFGKDRAPSKSAAHRFWQQLDELRGASWAKGA